MTKQELSLLLFLETRAVDYGGRVNTNHMNQDDMAMVDRWNDVGFLEFGRIKVKDHDQDGTNWVKFSAESFATAHMERLVRANRMWDAKTYQTTRPLKSEASS